MMTCCSVLQLFHEFFMFVCHFLESFLILFSFFFLFGSELRVSFTTKREMIDNNGRGKTSVREFFF